MRLLWVRLREDFICRCTFERRGVYPADGGAAICRADGGNAFDESGIGVCHAGRHCASAADSDRTGAFWGFFCVFSGGAVAGGFLGKREVRRTSGDKCILRKYKIKLNFSAHYAILLDRKKDTCCNRCPSRSPTPKVEFPENR